MGWNFLLNRSNKEEKERQEKEFKEKLDKAEDHKKKLNEYIAYLRKEQPVFYRIKDRFAKVYWIAAIVFTLWLLPIIYMVLNLNKPFMLILMILYGIITIPLPIISILAPTIKFFTQDLPKVSDEIKVYVGNKYLLAIFFQENRFILPKLVKIDPNNHFTYDKGDYVVDKTASFISVGKTMISFYIKGLPNPLRFDFNKYLNYYIEEKKKDPKKEVRDFTGNVLDVSFSSDNLREFKKNKIFLEFFRDYLGEANKLVMAILAFAGGVALIFLLMYILKK